MKEGNNKGNTEPYPDHPKPDVYPPSQTVKLAMVRVERESIGVADEHGLLRGKLEYDRLVHRENVVFHAQIQDALFTVGRSDAYGHVTGEVFGMLLADGSYDLMVDGVEAQAIIRVSYSAQYAIPDVGPCDNFGCSGGCKGKMTCPECIEEMKAKIQRLTKWVSDLQSGMYVNCVYCGHRYGPKDEVPTSMAEALKDHIMNCPQHPMSELVRENEELQQRLVFMEEERNYWETKYRTS